MARKLEGRLGDALGKDLRSGTHHGDGATAWSERRVARPCIIDGESACRSTAGGDKPRSLRTARGTRRGRPIEEGVMWGGVH
jgi:hypothetical protein